jgi:superfamily I DNA and RNA helicase
MVYIINADDCYDSYFPAFRARSRSQLFTAMTRSKAWVRVLGVGNSMNGLIEEYNAVKAHDFRLDFDYPNEEERKLLHIINRDMTQDQKKSLERNITDLDRIIDEIDGGGVNIEDLPRDLQRKLRKVLSKMK